jgi:hypothetical protein
MKWSDVGISFGPEDHPDTELSDKNLPFMLKIPIGWHKVTKTLIDNGASLMRKTFIEMGLNLAKLTPVLDTFNGIIPGQSIFSSFETSTLMSGPTCDYDGES